MVILPYIRKVPNFYPMQLPRCAARRTPAAAGGRPPGLILARDVRELTNYYLSSCRLPVATDYIAHVANLYRRGDH
jgi:hypothetical protein